MVGNWVALLTIVDRKLRVSRAEQKIYKIQKKTHFTRMLVFT